MESCRHITYECKHGYSAAYDPNCQKRPGAAHKGRTIVLRDRRVSIIECNKVQGCPEGKPKL